MRSSYRLLRSLYPFSVFLCAAVKVVVLYQTGQGHMRQIRGIYDKLPPSMKYGKIVAGLIGGSLQKF